MSEEIRVTMSATVGAIGAALAKAQLAMRPAVKDATNPHYKSSYATLASCVEALRPLHEQGIAVIQPPAAHGPDGVCVTTLLVHSSGEWIRGELYMPASKKDPQGFGSALSYARRYCLTSTTGLATDDDDGEAAVQRQPAPQSKAPAETGPNALEMALANEFDLAQTVNDIAAAEQAALRAVQAKKVVNGARERLLRHRSAAIARLEAAR